MSPELRAVLLDIEGTTTSISFVFEVLLPYVRKNLRTFIDRHLSDESVKADLLALAEENSVDLAAGKEPPVIQTEPPPAWVESTVAYVNWLMDLDRKSTPLKSLQGKIWRFGYEQGDLLGEVFPDVPPALARWRNQGRKVVIFSSGSVQAQKLLFAHTTSGDISHLIDGYFDTRIGAKTERSSYERIADQIGIPPGNILFVSDVAAELAAAGSAGLRTALSVRPGNHPQPEAAVDAVIESFDDGPLK